MKDFSYITHSDPAYIENLYQEFLKNPESVDPDFRKFFEGFDFAMSQVKTASNGNGAVMQPVEIQTQESSDWKREISAYRMILGYRNKGHLIADTNPIRKRKDRGANLDLSFFGFTEADLDKNFQAGTLIG